MGIFTIGLTGKTGGKMPSLCDYCLRMPSEVTMYIQQAHLALEHIFSLLVERHYFAAKPAAKG
jgi:D-sedoheptulose 7-phosphate isomerase